MSSVELSMMSHSAGIRVHTGIVDQSLPPDSCSDYIQFVQTLIRSCPTSVSGRGWGTIETIDIEIAVNPYLAVKSSIACPDE